MENNIDIMIFKAQLSGSIIAERKTVTLTKYEKMAALKEELSFVNDSNIGVILQNFDDCLDDKEFLKILRPFVSKTRFAAYGCLHKKGCYFKYLTFWLNAGGVVEPLDLLNFAAFEQGENEHLEELIDLYKSKGNEISDKSIAILKTCKKDKELVYKFKKIV